MGTNYYWIADACPHCHRGSRIHIGKSSAGWCFGLHVGAGDEDSAPTDLDGWRERWNRPGSAIVDEYGEVVTPEEMERRVTDRWWHRRGDFDYASNSAVMGPNGLARHRIDGRFCIGHGEGTWDLLVGEFS
jgi:hypothetical protein